MGECAWEINGSKVSYNRDTGKFAVDGEADQAGCGYRDMIFLVDDRIRVSSLNSFSSSI